MTKVGGEKAEGEGEEEEEKGGGKRRGRKSARAQDEKTIPSLSLFGRSFRRRP